MDPYTSYIFIPNFCFLYFLIRYMEYCKITVFSGVMAKLRNLMLKTTNYFMGFQSSATTWFGSPWMMILHCTSTCMRRQATSTKYFMSPRGMTILFPTTPNLVLTQLKNRTRMSDGKYKVNTLVCVLEVLKVYGKEAIQLVFANTEVLALRNVMGEGVSLTQEEWNILREELGYSSTSLASKLLDGARDDEFTYGDIVDLVSRVIKRHPLEGNSRICNKLVSFLSTYDTKKQQVRGHAYASTDEEIITNEAKALYERITEKTRKVYSKLIKDTDLVSICNQIDEISSSLPNLPHGVNQLSVSRQPNWYSSSEQFVDKTILLQLLFKSDEMSSWQKIESHEKPKHTNNSKRAPFDSHGHIIDHISNNFQAEYILFLLLLLLF